MGGRFDNCTDQNICVWEPVFGVDGPHPYGMLMRALFVRFLFVFVCFSFVLCLSLYCSISFLTFKANGACI
jgi:hypothetical protein